jgi:ribosomal protein L21
MNVELKVLENFRDDKVKVFKMKSKKRYARTK